MTKEYIHRELVLGKLGYDINPDIKAYNNLFNKLLGNVNDLTKRYLEFDNGTFGYTYFKDSDPILFYNQRSNAFIVNYVNFWKKFEQESNLKYDDVSVIFTVLLEKEFNFEVITAGMLPRNLCPWLDEVFRKVDEVKAKEYFHRELTLHKLNNELDSDVKPYIELFNELTEGLSKKRHISIAFRGFSYSKNGKKLLLYSETKEKFIVDYYYYWSKFKKKFNLKDYEIKWILTIMLEDVFGYKANGTDYRYKIK